jgi:hypothetical protein
MKSKNKLRLQQDKSRICRQIGILPNEEPKLILDRKEMRSLVTGRIQDSKRLAGRGECFYLIRTIFVDASYRFEYLQNSKGQYICEWAFNRNGRYVRRPIKKKATYVDFLHMLVHELVHYRFAYLQHGRDYKRRIKEILKGRTFEPKHVHLFSHMSKRYRAGIDDNPIIA